MKGWLAAIILATIFALVSEIGDRARQRRRNKEHEWNKKIGKTDEETYCDDWRCHRRG